MIRLEEVSKIYPGRNGQVKALDRIQLNVKEKEFVVVRGPSGSGKSTLLLTLGGMLRPTQGAVWIGEQDVYKFSGKERAEFRAQNVGFVFQMFHLIPYLTVWENVAAAAGKSVTASIRKDSLSLLEGLGLSHRVSHKPSELSAGEKQRTAIARALLNKPKIILADEPTGNLDPDNAHEVLQHLSSFHQNGGTLLMVTHGKDADPYADRIVYLRDGAVVESN
ncbi:MAG: ABC transporter ATP-binding protein [Candidatus Omnitrophica bacterium]|nr:ABC transporter ATP-binding protein [Candidatus Omnitrophota bacterium]